MTAILPWVLGVIFVIMVLAIFLWSKSSVKARKSIPEERPNIPNFKEEFADELVLPVKYNPATVQDTGPELPNSYGMDSLVLMVRDPDWLYAYWEITATKQEEFKSQYGPSAWGNSRPVLRLYDVTGVAFNGNNANSYIDISVSEEIDNWHIHVGRPDRAFCLDLGRIFPDGRFITLLRSNIVTTPRAALSDLVDEEWMWIEGLYRVNRYQVGISSPMIIEEIAERMGALPLNVSSPGFGNEQQIH